MNFKINSLQSLKLWLPLTLLIAKIECDSTTEAPATTLEPTTTEEHDFGKEFNVVSVSKPVVCPRRSKRYDRVTIHYEGLLMDGEVFDSSYARQETYTFQLGIGEVIKAWERGLVGLCVGEKIKMTVPPHMGFGPRENDGVPGNSTLIYEIEMVDIQDTRKPANIFKWIDKNNDNKITMREYREYLKYKVENLDRYREGESPPDDEEQAMMIKDVFERDDVNNDGYITHAEFEGPKHDHDEL